jgi:hypothetical protein
MFWGKRQEPYLEIREKKEKIIKKPYYKVSLKLRKGVFGIVGSCSIWIPTNQRL